MDSVVAPVLLFGIFSAVVYYVIVPFMGPRLIVAGDEQDTASLALELRKMSLFKQLREVEFEQEMGLVDESEYGRIRDDLMGEVATVMETLDVAGGTAIPNEPPPSSGVCGQCAADIETDAQYCGQCGARVGSNCSNCNGVVRPDDHFCGHCGRGLIN